MTPPPPPPAQNRRSRAPCTPRAAHTTERRLCQVGMLLPTSQLEELMVKKVSSGSCRAQTCALASKPALSSTWEAGGRGGWGACLVRAAGAVGLGGQKGLPFPTWAVSGSSEVQGEPAGLASPPRPGSGPPCREELGDLGAAAQREDPKAPPRPWAGPPPPPAWWAAGARSTSRGPAAEGRALARPVRPPAERCPRPGPGCSGRCASVPQRPASARGRGLGL